MTIEIPRETRKQRSERVENQAKAIALVMNFFEGDKKKAEAWFFTPNPLLGNMEPSDLIRIGRSDMVLRFVEEQLAQNKKG